MKTFIVYCHPSENSFTKSMCDAFIKGVVDSGNEYILSDLYKMGFQTDMTEEEYQRGNENPRSRNREWVSVISDCDE